MKAATILQGEFIGLKAKVVKSTNPSYMGISGSVVDETRNTVMIRQGGEDKVIVKNVAIFQFTLPDGSIVEVDGGAIVGRAEDRVKKRPKRRW